MSEISLDRHISFAQLPVLHETEQLKIAACSNISSGKQALQGGMDTLGNADDKIDLDTFRRFRYQFGSNLKAFGDTSLQTGMGSSTSAGGTFGATSTVLAEKLSPVSSFMGSTLGTCTGIMQSPMGSLSDLPNTLGHLMDRTNPRLRSSLETALHTLNINKLMEMPKSIYGSIEQFAQKLKGIFAAPIRFITDLYYGAMKILDNIKKLIESLFNVIQKFVNNIIDMAFPGLMDFLNSILSFASKISNIVSSFGVGSSYLGVLNQGISMASSLSRAMRNPMSLMTTQHMPEGIAGGFHILSNPESALKQMVPKQFSSWLNGMGSSSGFGRGGNMGFGFGQILGGMQAGILAGVIDSVGSQFAIMSPILNRSSHDLNSYEYNTRKSTLVDGTTYQTNVAGEKVLEKPRTSVVRAKTADNSVIPEASPISYFAQDKQSQSASATSTLSLQQPTKPQIISLGNASPIKLFGD